MKRIILIIVIIFIALGLTLILTINILGTRTDIVNGINGTKIKKVKLNMTIEQVFSILGRPYRINASRGLHNIGCKNPHKRLDIETNNKTDIKSTVNNFYNDTNYCCDGNKEDMQNKEVSLEYTRPIKLSKNYPMLWIHLDNNFCVNSIYAKSYSGIFGLDDKCIYSLSWEMDTISLKIIYGKTDLFINEKIFNECFK